MVTLLWSKYCLVFNSDPQDVQNLGSISLQTVIHWAIWDITFRLPFVPWLQWRATSCGLGWMTSGPPCCLSGAIGRMWPLPTGRWASRAMGSVCRRTVCSSRGRYVQSQMVPPGTCSSAPASARRYPIPSDPCCYQFTSHLRGKCGPLIIFWKSWLTYCLLWCNQTSSVGYMKGRVHVIIGEESY